MCLSKAYVDNDGQPELLMEEVTSLESDGNRLLLKTLFGEQREIRADIRQIDFLAHNIFLGNYEKGKS